LLHTSSSLVLRPEQADNDKYPPLRPSVVQCI
jgi:hypothetical protein